MSRLSLDTYKQHCRVFDLGIDRQSKTWIDNLPHGCELTSLWKIGVPFDECMELVGMTQSALNKRCRATCGTYCKACYEKWSKVTNILIEGQQLDKAAKGDSQMLTWLGKARLKQTEPVVDNEQIVPTQINIVGLNASQERELEELRAQMKALKAGNTVDDTTTVVESVVERR